MRILSGCTCMCMGSGTHTRFIGEESSCNTIADRFSYSDTCSTTHDSRRLECAYQNLAECFRDHGEVASDYNQAADDIDAGHKGYQFFNNKDRELKDTQAELQKVREALEAKEGEQNHGNNKESNS